MANKPRKPTQRPTENRPPSMQGASRRVPRVIEEPSFIERFRTWIISGVAAAVLLVVVAIIVLKATSGGSSSGNNAVAQPASAGSGTALVAAISAIPVTTFDAVGTGTYKGGVQPPPSQAQPLTANGKPDVFYFGAEWCPYCAAQRWAFTAALSRFGTFDNVGTVRSDAKDVYPSTATLTFNGSSYSSQYVSFSPVEAQNANHKPLQNPSTAQSQILQQFDSGLSFPFLDFGNAYIANGASYDPAILQGMTQQQIVDALKDPTSDQAKGILGTANVMTAAICKLTNNQPANVCSSPGVQAGAAKLGK
jgi:thiol-disulfide isomerase/thioredoxin